MYISLKIMEDVYVNYIDIYMEDIWLNCIYVESHFLNYIYLEDVCLRYGGMLNGITIKIIWDCNDSYE